MEIKLVDVKADWPSSSVSSTIKSLHGPSPTMVNAAILML